MFGLGKKKSSETVIEVLAPVDGEIIPTSSVTEDEMFKTDLMGKGLAIIPSSGDFASPISGKLETVFPTGHAYGIKHASGLAMLMHIGVDTVKMKGEGFTTKVNQGQIVKAGDELVHVDLAKVKRMAKTHKTPILILTESLENFKITYDVKKGMVKRGDKIMTITKNS